MRKNKLIWLLAGIILAACGTRTTPTLAPVPPSATPAPTANATTSAPLAILVLPADMPQAAKDGYQTMIYDLAQTAGMRFQLLNSLSPADLALAGPSLRVVVAFPPDPGLAALASAAVNVQFLAVGIPDLPAVPNLSTIGANGLPVDQQAFLAGYIAGLLAPEWKVGILYQKDTPGGTTARDAFTNGFVFYCGSCRNPLFPQPAGIYPVTVPIPTDAKPGEYPSYANLLLRNVVKVAYVYPEIATPDLLDYMAQKNLLLIGQTLPDDTVRSQWIASIQADTTAAIKSTFPQLVAGHGGQIIPTPLFLTDVNPDLLTAGKLRLVQQVLDGLQNGTIGTGINP